MSIGLVNIVCNHILKREHSLDIQVPCSSDEIAFVGIFGAQLKSDEVTSIVDPPTIHEIVFLIFPPAWFYFTDTFSPLGRHGFLTDNGIGKPAATKRIEV